MNTDNYAKYNHYKPPHMYTPKMRYGGAPNNPCPAAHACPDAGESPACPGLLQYRRWWERREAYLAVNGEHIAGIPIFVKDNTLRVVNDDYSFFIPMEKIDYIRTNDGLHRDAPPAAKGGFL